MQKIALCAALMTAVLPAQELGQQLELAVKKLAHSPEMENGQISFYVSNAAGQSVYQYQHQLALSPASSQKIFVAIAALELLGPDFKFKTDLSYSGTLNKGTIKGHLYLNGQADPSLGSAHLASNPSHDFIQNSIKQLKAQNIHQIEGDLILNDTYLDLQQVPGGWPWNDIGNYYGAGVFGINWRENYYTLSIKAGQKAGDSTQIMAQNPQINPMQLANFCLTGPAGSGDKSLVFSSPQQNKSYINGTVEAGKTTLVKASIPQPATILGQEIHQALRQNGITLKGKITCLSDLYFEGKTPVIPKDLKLIYQHQSPKLSALLELYLQKSINLYGEALLKTMAIKQYKNSTYPVACQHLKDFWISKGLKPNELDFIDGSGLSPQNYVSAQAEVLALQYAKKQTYFQDFYQALPIYNQMKMKSGTISKCKAFAGYHQSKSGENYQFAIILNHYTGHKASEAIFNILNLLK